MGVKPKSNIEQKAWDFAIKAHSGVKRKFTDVSYFDGHIRKVYQILKGVDTNPVLGAASLLHDSIKDVDDVTYEIHMRPSIYTISSNRCI